MLTTLTILLLAALTVLLGTAAFGIGAMLFGLGRVPATAGAGAISSPAPGGWLRTRLVFALGLAFVLLLTAAVLRATLIGHAPWSTLHEFSITFAAALLGTYLVLLRAAPIGGLAPLIALVDAGIVGLALSLEDHVDPLVPTLQQPLLLTTHVGAAALAYAIAGVAFVAAAAEIGQRASDDRIGLLPSAGVVRAVSHRAVLLALPVLTIAIALGSVWANLAWRSYWSNDPKELAAAATWLVFGDYLHVAGRRDRWERLAPWLIVGEHSYGRQ